MCGVIEILWAQWLYVGTVCIQTVLCVFFNCVLVCEIPFLLKLTKSVCLLVKKSCVGC